MGEVRRILNSFLQMIEQDESHSLIVAATNHPEILDQALFRRFDDILHYGLPDETQIAALLKARLGRKARKGVAWKRLAAKANGLSYAEIVRACDEVLKEAVIDQKESIGESGIRRAIEERAEARSRFDNQPTEPAPLWQKTDFSPGGTSFSSRLRKQNAFGDPEWLVAKRCHLETGKRTAVRCCNRSRA